jgi:hypothetical protein
MKKLFVGMIFAASAAFAILSAAPAAAAGLASPDEAKELALKAAGFLRANGPDKAFPAFTAQGNEWHDRDLYVFVYDDTGHAVAHGGNPALVGKSLIDLKDVDGVSFVRAIIAVQDAGWVDYKWKNPVTGTVGLKTSYIVKVDTYRVGVGAYKQ